MLQCRRRTHRPVARDISSSTTRNRFYREVKTLKIVALDDVAKRVQQLRAGGKQIVATNGRFDLLHAGHVRYLKVARALGNVPVIGLNGHKSVHELKGAGRPINTASDRDGAL